MIKSDQKESLNIKERLRDNQLLYVPQYLVLFDNINFKPFVFGCLNEHINALHDDDQILQVLQNELLQCLEGKLAIVNKTVYYLDSNSGHWVAIDASSISSCKLFIEVICSSVCSSAKICKKIPDYILGRITLSQGSNNTIQFNDCYLDNDGIHQGISNQIKPKHRINRNIYDSILKGHPLSQSYEVNDLLQHISNYDDQTYNRLLDDLSMILVTNSDITSSLGRFMRFYGPTGENGKSTLMNLISKSLGPDNIGAFKTHDFKSYHLASAVDYLMVVDDDEQGRRIPEESSANIKSTVTSGELQVRQIRGEPYNIKPTVSLASLSNSLPKSEDKTNGFARRLDWFYIEDKLVRNPQWFNNLFDEKSYQYLIELLVINALHFINHERTHLSEKSEQMIKLDNSFKKNNASVIEFIEDYGHEWLNDRTILKSYNEYQHYCEDNLLQPIGSQNFTKMIVHELNVDKKKITVSKTKDKDDIMTFKDSLPLKYKEYIDLGKIAFNNSVDIGLETDMYEEAKEIVNNKRVLTFVEK